MGTYTGQDKRLQYLFQNGGGGGGSSVIPNPQGDATDELEKLQIENTIYGLPTAIGAVGLFVDTNRVIKASTAIPANTDISYTATEDCFVRYSLVTAANAQAKATIDGVTVFTTYIPSTVGVLTLGDSAYLKRGQTITFRQSYTQSNGSYTVYGLLRGSEGGIYVPACYSTEERQVGCWHDGKPLYQKTVHISALPSTAFASTTYPHNIANVDKICGWDGTAVTADGTATAKFNVPQFNSSGFVKESSFVANVTKTDIAIIVGANRSTWSSDFTIQYTKTTDTAGSGIWTPQGGLIKTYHANWTATASTAVNTKLTQELDLPAGKYLAVTHLAYSTSMNLAQFAMIINDVASFNTIAYVPISYGNASLYFELTAASRVAFGTATGLSMSWDSQYINRGGMDIIKVA